jgi:hypothetical protein
VQRGKPSEFAQETTFEVEHLDKSVLGVYCKYLPLWGYSAGCGKAKLLVCVSKFSNNPFHLALVGKYLDSVVSGVRNKKLVVEAANSLRPQKKAAFFPEPAKRIEETPGFQIQALDPPIIAVYDVSDGFVYCYSLRPVELSYSRTDGNIIIDAFHRSFILPEPIASIFGNKCNDEFSIRRPYRELRGGEIQKTQGTIGSRDFAHVEDEKM